MLLVLLGHLVVAGAAVAIGRRSPRRALLVGAAAPAITVVWLAAHTSSIIGGNAVVVDHGWVDALGLRFGLRVDAFGLLMGWMIAGIGVLVFWYAYSYFDTIPRRLGAFAATLVVFSGSMLGIVFADDVFTLFLFWELTSVTSYLLIGFKGTDDSARASALQALLITASGGLAMLAGLVMLSIEAGTSSLSAWLADPPSGGTVPAALVLVVVGAATKSAQFPFHFWLPGAMAAPTPVSAYLHSAAMVKAGVYLLARLAPAFAEVSMWRPLVVGIGSVTMLFGGVVAMRRHDLKQLLAYGTISQLGFLVVLFGAGVPALTTAGVAMLLAHGVFKACLFMVVGIIDHSTGTRDIRQLSGLGRRCRVLAVVAVAAGASMAGAPPLLGFVAKEKALASLLDPGVGPGSLLVVVVAAGSVLTVAYSARILWGAFGAKSGVGVEPTEVRPPTRGFLAPAAALAVFGLVAGVVPATVNALVTAASRALDPAAGSKGLVLWPGVNTALAISAGILAFGAVAHLLRGRIDAFGGRLPLAMRGEHVFRALVSGLLRLSERVAAVVQPGSLPHYLAVIAVTIVVLPGAALAFGGARWPDTLVLADTPIQAVAAVGIVAAAVAAAVSWQRLTAVLTFGVVGFGVAVLFVIEGGPDLALTQFLVETVALVAFVLVLRHLPDRYPRRVVDRGFGLARQIGRLTLSVAVGAVVFAFAVSATAVRTATPVGVEALERAAPDAGGRNVVNVILVDFRALDTLGEITVLAVAAVGTLSLLGVTIAGHRGSRKSDRPVTADPAEVVS